MYNLISTITLALLLTACDTVSSVQGLLEQQNQGQEYVQQHYGLDSQLGFQITNGVLEHVTLGLNAKDVQSYHISQLESMARDVAAHTFESEPQALTIQLFVSQQ